MNIYGIIDSSGAHIDVSKSEKGAKQYATLNGYSKVSIRYNSGYDVDIIATKVKGRWIKSKNQSKTNHNG